MQRKLRELVGSWIDSGPDLLVMFRKHPSLEGQLQGGSTLLLPMRGGKAYLEWQPFPATLSDLPPEEQALRYFALLITNPLWHRLGGPCARCGDYYLKNTVRQKTYCSRRCGSIRSAAEAVERRRENEYQQKIQRAQAAIEEWRDRKRREEWDSWVARHAKLTRHWITRAANKGKITPPSADPRARIASAQRKRWAKHKKEAATMGT